MTLLNHRAARARVAIAREDVQLSRDAAEVLESYLGTVLDKAVERTIATGRVRVSRTILKGVMLENDK